MASKQVGALMKAMASVCAKCTLCRAARKKQKGFAFFFVKKIERYFCPFCMAYEKVYSRKAHESDRSIPVA